MAVDQQLAALLFMLNAQITLCFSILNSFRRVNEITRTLEEKLAESRKQCEAARLRAQRRHRMLKATTLCTRLMQLGVSDRRMWMLRRPQGAVFWTNVLENFTADQWRQQFRMSRNTLEFVQQLVERSLRRKSTNWRSHLNHAVDWLLFCGGMLPLANTAQSVVFLVWGCRLFVLWFMK